MHSYGVQELGSTGLYKAIFVYRCLCINPKYLRMFSALLFVMPTAFDFATSST